MMLRFAAVAVTVVHADRARADQYVYTIDPNQSQINLIATGNAFNSALVIAEQSPTAVTRFSGTLVTEQDPSGLSFPTGSAAAAGLMKTPGIFGSEPSVQPGVGGSGAAAKANYAVTLTAPFEYDIPPFDISGISYDIGAISAFKVDVALRNLILGVESAGPIAGTTPYNTTFDPSALSVAVNSGAMDFRVGIELKQDNFLTYLANLLALQGLAGAIPDVGLSVTGNNNILSPAITLGWGGSVDLGALNLSVPNDPEDLLANGTLSTLANHSSTLKIPLNFAAVPDLGLGADVFNIQFQFTGQLVGTATVPEASSLALVGLAGFAGLLAIRQRRSSPSA